MVRMPGSDSASMGRVCPSCGRRVPRKIEVCRCGARLPPIVEIEIPGDDQPLSPSDFAEGIPTVLGVAAVMGGVVLLLYYLGRPPVRTPRPPPTLPMKTMPAPVEREPSAPLDAPPAPVEPAATPGSPTADASRP